MDKRARAALRKQRQRAKLKASGFRSIELELKGNTLETLLAIKKLTGGALKTEAETILSRAAVAYLKETQGLLATGDALWDRFKKYEPYRNYLLVPDAYFRLKDVVLTGREWSEIQQQMTSYLEDMRRKGWAPGRTLRTLAKRAASRRQAEPAKVPTGHAATPPLPPSTG